MPNHRSSSSNMGFHNVICLFNVIKTCKYVAIPHWKLDAPMCLEWAIIYSIKIRDFMNLLRLNPGYWTYVISVSHIVLTNSEIIIVCIFLY